MHLGQKFNKIVLKPITPNFPHAQHEIQNIVSSKIMQDNTINIEIWLSSPNLEFPIAKV